jgi:hypothetical protein
MEDNKSKDQVKNLVDEIEGMSDLEKAILLRKIEQGIAESERGEGQDWEEFKKEWRLEDKLNDNN